MATTAGLYDPGAPGSGFASILARARSLLPVEDFHVSFDSEPLYKPVFSVGIEFVPCLNIPPVCPVPVINIDNELFSLPDDKIWAMFWLTVKRIRSADPAGCKDVHWVGTASAGAVPFNGFGGMPGTTIQDWVPELPPIPVPNGPWDTVSLVRMEPGSGTGKNPWDIPVGGATLAHELGHNYGRRHILQNGQVCGGSTPDGPYHNYPFNSCTIGPTSGNGTLFGFDPISQLVIPPTVGGDLMSYSTSSWISKFNWDAIWDETESGQGLAKPAPAFATPQPSGSVLLVHGNIDPTQNIAEFRPFYLLPPGSTDAAKVSQSLAAASQMPATSPYKLRLLDGAGNNISEAPAVVAAGAGAGPRQLGFVQFIEFNPLTRRIQLFKAEAVLAERFVSTHAPTLAQPVAAVNAAEQTVNLSWTAADADRDPLLFTIQYSADDGASWHALRVDYPWLAVTLSTRLLQASTQARLRVIATDGVNSAIGTSEPFTVAQHPPELQIAGLVEGQRVNFGQAVTLEGLALDAEDGSLPSDDLRWDLGGRSPLTSTGAALRLIDLPPSEYGATVTATDSSGQTGSARLNFEVLPLTAPDGPVPVVDGACADLRYAEATFVRIPLGKGEFARIRLLHAEGNLYVSFTDLRFGGLLSRRQVGLRVDVNASRDSRAQTGDVGFYVSEDGIPSQLSGNGTSMQATLSPQEGFKAVVQRGTNGWCAEFRIADSLIGGWNHAAGLMFSYERAGVTTNIWPPLALVDRPVGWAPAHLGRLPEPVNRAPVASAGTSRSVDVAAATRIVLNGTGSVDPDGDRLTFAWSQVAGPSITLSNATSATPHFIAQPVAVPTALRFRLVVNDGKLNSPGAETEVSLVPTAAPEPISRAPAAAAKMTEAGFHVRLMGQAGQRYQVEASTDLKQWTILSTNTVDFYSTIDLIDTESKNFPMRFYRGRKQ